MESNVKYANLDINRSIDHFLDEGTTWGNQMFIFIVITVQNTDATFNDLTVTNDYY